MKLTCFTPYKYNLLKISTFLYFSQASLLAFAQPQIQEIIVTSQKREESLQDVSVSVTAIDGDKLADKGIARVEELAAYVPNLTLTETGIGTTIYIRGIGSGINQGFEQSVGMYVDGVYYGRAQLTRSPFFDMERVEVLRGPQVTLFGNNSIGGALSFTTARPTEELSATVSVTHDDQYGEKEMVFIANGAINNSARVRLAYRKFDFNGYLENLTLNRDEPKRNYDTVRLTFDFDITDSWQSLLKLEYSTFDVKGRQIRIIKDGTDAFPVNNGSGFAATLNNWIGFLGGGASFQNNATLAQMWSQGFAGGETVIDVNNEDARYANGDFSENDVENLTWINNFSLNEVDLELTLAHMAYSYDEKCDCDFSGLDFINFFAEEEYSQQSIEFRFSSPGGELIDWIAGAYYQQDDLDFNDKLGVPAEGPLKTLFEGIPVTVTDADDLVNSSAPRVFNQESQQSAIFASSTINFTDATRLILGARYSNIKKEASRSLKYTNFDGSDFLGSQTNPVFGDRLFALDTWFSLIFRSYRHEIEGELDDERVSWNVILEQDLNENNMLYASVTDGFKAGGFDVRSNSVPRDQVSTLTNTTLVSNPNDFAAGAFEFDREEALAYELGLKSNIGGFLEVNTALYYTEIKNLQTSVFDGALGFNVGNAGAATSKGIEIDGRAAFTENLFMNFSFSAADFEFTDYPNGLCTSDELLELGLTGLAVIFDPEDPSTCYNQGQSSTALGIVAGKDRKGTTNQYVADYAGSVGFIFEKELSDLLFNFSIDMNFTDDYHTTQNLDENVIQKAFEKYNARLSLGDLDDRWEIAVLGRNLTDKRTIGFSNNVPLSTTQFGTSTYYGFVSPPRQVLVQGKFNF